MKVIVRRSGKVVAERKWTGVISLGRSSTNEVVLSHPDVSRKHVTLTLQGETVLVEDQNSFNGTLFQGDRVEKAELHSGDFFLVGPFELYLEGPEGSAPPPKPRQTTGASFEDAIAVRPPSKEPAVQELRVLDSFLNKETSEPGSYTPKAEERSVSQARLVRLSGDQAGREIPLEKPETTFGGDDSADIIIHDTKVATRQAAIRKRENSFVIRDEQDQTGTFIDGVPVHERELENHDVIQIGEDRFEYLEGDSRSQIESSYMPPYQPPSRISGLVQFFSDWRLLALGGIVTGLVLLAILPADKVPIQALQERLPKKPAPAPTQAATPSEVNENIRLTRFHLQEARRFFKEKNLDEAEVHLKPILNSLDPKNKDAKSLQKKINSQRAEAKRNIQEAEAKKRAREEEITKLLDKGNDLIMAKKIDEARKVFMRLLTIDPNNTDAKSAVENIQRVEEMKKEEAANRAKTEAEMKKKYGDGVTKFEAGQFGEAEQLLSEVAATSESKYQASAKKILDQIQKQTDSKIKVRLTQAKKMLDDGQLLQAHAELEKIVKAFPQRQDAGKLFIKAETKLLELAKKTYAEGLAAQQLADDPVMALEKYQEVLKYSPDPKSEYHLKAEKKIRELNLLK